MARERLERANRAVLRAIETPPDSGIEDRLDELAARTWRLAREGSYDPDHGQLERLQHRLSAMADRVDGRRERELRRARAHLKDYRRRLGPV